MSASKHVFYGRIAKVGVIWTFLGRGFYELVQIPASMVTARLLTPEEFGVVAAANVFVQIAQRLTNFGFNTALMQRGELHDDHKSTVFVASSVVGVAMWLILTVLSPFFSSMFRSRDLAYVLPVVGAVFLINSLASVPIALMARDLRFRENTVLNGLHATVTAGVGIWLAWRGWGVWSLIWAQVAAAVVHTVARLAVCGWWPRLRFSRARLQELLSFGIGLHFQRLLEAAALNVDNLVIGRLLGLSALGFYDKSFTMMNRAVMLTSSAAPAVGFRILAIIHDDPVRFRIAYRKVLLATSFVAYPLLGVLIGLAPELFRLLFGPQWDAAVMPFQVLCVAGMLKTLNTLQSTAAQSTGQVWGEVKRQLVYLALIVAGAGIGSYWGLVGASLGVLAASVTMAVLMQSFLRRVTSLAWRDLIEPQVPAAVCALAIAALLWALRPWVIGQATTASAAIKYGVFGSVVAAVVAIGFVRFAPFAELRQVTEEIVEDLFPALLPLVRSRG